MDNVACFGLPQGPWRVEPKGTFGVTVMSKDGGSLALIIQPTIEKGAYVQTWKRNKHKVAASIAAIPDAIDILVKHMHCLNRGDDMNEGDHTRHEAVTALQGVISMLRAENVTEPEPSD